MVRLSIRAKLISGFLLVLFPVLILLLYNYKAEYERRSAVILDEQMRTAQVVAALVDASFDDTIDLGWAIATNPIIKTFDPNVIDPYLEDLMTHYPQYEIAGAFNRKGDSVGTSLPYPQGQPRINIADRPQFQQPMATNAPLVSEVFMSLRTSRPVIAVGVPIRDEFGQPVGVFDLLLYTNALPDRLAGINLAPEQNIGLTDRTGRLAFFAMLPDISWEQRDVSTLPVVQDALQGEASKLEQFEPLLMSGAQLGAFTPTPKYGWVVGITVPVDTALAPAQEALTKSLVLFGGVALFSLLISLIFSQQFVSPLRRLAENAIALGRGELKSRVYLNTGDELDDLAKAFNSMASELEERLAENTRLAQEQERQAALLKSSIESMTDGVITYKTTGEFQSVNQAAVRLLGYSSREVMPDSLKKLSEAIDIRHTDGEAVPFEELGLVKAMQTGEAASGEERLVRKADGQDIYVNFSAAPVRNGVGETIMAVAVMRDVSEIRKLERMRDEFLSVAAHELKTPVTAIKGYVQLMKQWAPEGHEPREGKAITTINRQCDRLSRLVNELLEVSRLQVGLLDLHKETFDLGDMVRELCTRASATTQKHSIMCEVDSDVVVNADRDRLEQVVLNLLDNAVKFSPDGGIIQASMHRTDGQVIVSVKDHGVGIPAGREHHLFERFYRAHAGTQFDYGGMGMGLFISKEIVEKHNGKIWFETEEGKGSTFFFSLPLAGGPGNGAR